MHLSYYVITIALIVAFQKQKENPHVASGSRFPNLFVENGNRKSPQMVHDDNGKFPDVPSMVPRLLETDIT